MKKSAGTSVEERLKNRLGNNVLREHFNGLLLGDGGVDVLPQAAEKLLKSSLVLPVSLDEAVDSFGLPLCNFRNILRPLLPVAPVANLLHQTGKEDALYVAGIAWPTVADCSP